jgi:hypothetical protein
MFRDGERTGGGEGEEPRFVRCSVSTRREKGVPRFWGKATAWTNSGIPNGVKVPLGLLALNTQLMIRALPQLKSDPTKRDTLDQ